MDMQTLDPEVFLRSLTRAQMDECERDEKRLAEVFEAGWSEEIAVLFHRAVLVRRRTDPAVTVEGVFEVALMIGLSVLGCEKAFALLTENPVTPPTKLRRAPKKRGVRGV